MRYNTIKKTLFLCLLILFSIEKSYGFDDCSADQKRTANDILALVGADPQQLERSQRLHMPFGLHGARPGAKPYVLDADILYQTSYLMRHDERLKTSLWVAYRLTSADRARADGVKRLNCFRADPRLSRNEGANLADYRGSGYDRGHLANDADLKDVLYDQLNSYVMSNMAPQTCHLNRGIWLSMEELTRRWAERYGTIFVTSGVVFDHDNNGAPDDLADIPKLRDRVAIGSHYYKIILRREAGQWHSIAFLRSNDRSLVGPGWDAVTIAEIKASIIAVEDIEVLTDIAFHPALSGEIQSVDGSDWDFTEGGRNFSGSCQAD